MTLRATRNAGYDYIHIQPEEYNRLRSKVHLGLGPFEWKEKHPASRWAKTEEALLRVLPELEGFEDHESGFGRISKGQVEAGKILDAIENIRHRVVFDAIDIIDDDGVRSTVKLPDIKEAHPYLRYGLPFDLPKVRLEKIPADEIRPYQSAFRISVYRSGHDGIANGGSYGWYRTIWSDGEIISKRDPSSDKSSRQYGHRLNYHADDYEVDVRIEGGTWAVVLHRYHGQIYDHPDEWEYFGPVPENFRRYNKVTI